MRRTLLALTMVIGLTPALAGCMSDQQETPPSPPQATEPAPSTQPEQPATPTPSTEQPDQAGQTNEQPSENPTDSTEQVYQNDIFQDVTVVKTGEDTYTVKGKARIFEAAVDYVVEDGHNELAKGSVQASKGAPDWGEFTIDLNVKKVKPNSTLILILFETSANDGSRQNELLIALPQ